MDYLHIETFRWTLSAVFQGVAALSAIVGVFLVFLLSDRVTRRNDMLVELRAGLTSFCKTLKSWRLADGIHLEIAEAIADRMKVEGNELASYFAEESQAKQLDILYWKWNRYGVARSAADQIHEVWSSFVSRLNDADRMTYVDLDFARQQAHDLELALTGMKKQIIAPGTFSALTMLTSVILLAFSDSIFSLTWAKSYACLALVATGSLLVLTLIFTGRSIKRLLFDWDQ